MGSYPTGTPAAARHHKRGPTISFFLALTGGGLVPMRPAKWVARPKRQRFEQANRQAEADAFGGGPRQQGGRRGARCQRPPRCSRPPTAPFAAEGSLPGKHAHGLRRWAGCAWVQRQQQQHGRLAPPFWPRCRSAPLWGKGRRRRRCAACLANPPKRAKHWGWTKPLAERPPLPLTNSSKPPVTTPAAKACVGP